MGPGFSPLRLGPRARGAEEMLGAARARGVPARLVEPRSAAARDLYGRDLAPVRPDGHLAWRGDGPPADAARVLARVTGG